MLKEPPTFSTIRTPSTYPASHKRYRAGNTFGSLDASVHIIVFAKLSELSRITTRDTDDMSTSLDSA